MCRPQIRLGKAREFGDTILSEDKSVVYSRGQNTVPDSLAEFWRIVNDKMQILKNDYCFYSYVVLEGIILSKKYFIAFRANLNNSKHCNKIQLQETLDQVVCMRRFGQWISSYD